MTTPTLTASYTSPTNAPFSQSTPLPLPSSSGEPSTADKTAHLSALRTAISALQTRINTELTDRMDDNNAREQSGLLAAKQAAKKRKASKAAVDEDAEEENYGEEVVEEN